MTTYYATVQEVKEFLQTPNITSEYLPDTAIEKFINMSEDYIDRYCGTAWREVKVFDELHNLSKTGRPYMDTGIPVFLNYSPIRMFDKTLGDEIKVWNGSYWEDILDTNNSNEGRGKKFWVDYNNGVVFFNMHYLFYKDYSVKITYRYGYTNVPNDIKYATILLTAIKILSNESRSTITPAGEAQFIGYDNRIKEWKEEVKEILNQHKKPRVFSF